MLRGGAVVARQAHNLKAGSSILSPATNRNLRTCQSASPLFMLVLIVFVKFCKMKSPEKADAEQLSFEERRLCSAGTAVRRNVTRLQF